jgi:hypothetical protein
MKFTYKETNLGSIAVYADGKLSKVFFVRGGNEKIKGYLCVDHKDGGPARQWFGNLGWQGDAVMLLDTPAQILKFVKSEYPGISPNV